MQVVVVGGGIIGAATAHYLAAKGARPLVVEACSPACSASGKAGGVCGRRAAVGPGGFAFRISQRQWGPPLLHAAVARGQCSAIMCAGSAASTSTISSVPLVHTPLPSLTGGFLALDWCDGQAVGRLARRSFELHAELAESLGVDCGYRRVTTHSISVKQGGAPGGLLLPVERLPCTFRDCCTWVQPCRAALLPAAVMATQRELCLTAGTGGGAARLPSLPGWVQRDHIGQATIIGTEDTTAQVPAGSTCC